MNKMIMMIVVLLPMLSGVLIPLLPFRNRRQMMIYIETAVLLNTILVFLMLANPPQNALVLFKFTGNLSVSFRLDGLGRGWPGRHERFGMPGAVPAPAAVRHVPAVDAVGAV